MPADINYRALHAELCKFLPKAVEWSERHYSGLDWSKSRSLGKAVGAMTDAGEAILRIAYWPFSGAATPSSTFLDIPLAFAFGKIGLANLIDLDDSGDKMAVITRAIAYLEIEHLGDEGPGITSD